MMEPYWGSFFNEINPGLMFGPSQAGSPNHGVGTVIEQATNGIPRKNSFKSYSVTLQVDVFNEGYVVSIIKFPFLIVTNHFRK
jgi:hypothetical protein